MGGSEKSNMALGEFLNYIIIVGAPSTNRMFGMSLARQVHGEVGTMIRAF